MRILHIITSLESGGAERMLTKLVNYDNENMHIIVTLLAAPNHYDIEKTKNIKLNKKNNIKNKILIVCDLIKIIKEEEIDIVQTWSKSNYYGPILKYRYPQIQVISNFRNGLRIQMNPLKKFIYNKMLNKFDGHIFVSYSALKERLKANLKFKNYTIITNGFQIPNIKDDKSKNISNNLIIGHLGRYHPIKNQENIIKAFDKFSEDKEVSLLLAGRNLNLNSLNMPEAYNPKITFLGEISDVDNFYRQIDVLILNSISEGFPNVLGEAMSHGVFPLATDAGDSFKILGNNGYKLKRGNVSEIIKAFEYVNINKKAIEKERYNIRKRIQENYSIDLIIEEYQKFYKSLEV